MEKMIDLQQIPADITADVYYRIYDDYIPDNIDKEKLALVHELIYYSWLKDNGYVQVDKNERSAMVEGEDHGSRFHKIDLNDKFIYESRFHYLANIDLEIFSDEHGKIDPYYFYEKYDIRDFMGMLDDMTARKKHYQHIVDDVFGSYFKHRSLRGFI